MKNILAIDPGNKRSAWLLYNPEVGRPIPDRFGIWDNEDLVRKLRRWHSGPIRKRPPPAVLVVETFRPRGQPMYWQLIETAIWIGRFVEAWGGPFEYVTRSEAKHHVCGATNVKDGNVRAALIDRWGGKEKAVGLKKSPGPLHGISKDIWAALAVAVTYAERKC